MPEPTQKSPLTRARKFVKENQTPIACVASAVGASVATVYVSRSIDLRIMRQFAYDAGYATGMLSLYVKSAAEFLENKGLTKEFQEQFAASYAK